MNVRRELKQWHDERMIEKVLKSLENRGFKAYYVSSGEEAVKKALTLIPVDAKIGVGGSMTIRELKLLDKLAERGHQIIRHDIPGLTLEKQFEIRREELTVDVFLSSTNAITLDGEIVNMDGTGNRVAALAFGPKKVIIIAGVNKIVKDLNSAIWRIENVAAPINAKRLKKNTPCTISGFCMDCSTPDRICNILLILKRKPSLTDYHVILVGEELGF